MPFPPNTVYGEHTWRLPVSLGVTARMGITLLALLISSSTSAFFPFVVIECPHHTHQHTADLSAELLRTGWMMTLHFPFPQFSLNCWADETSTLDISFKVIQRDLLLFCAVSGVSASREVNPAPYPSTEFA